MKISGCSDSIFTTTPPLTPTASDQDTFLKILRATGNATKACRGSGLSRQVINEMKREDEHFSASYTDAMDEAADLLEAEAWRRAIDGVSQPLLKGGQIVLDPATGQPMTVQRYSDPLLVMLLRGHRPAKFSLRGAATSSSIDAGAVLREMAADNDPPRAGTA